jgi:hypothetical protein
MKIKSLKKTGPLPYAATHWHHVFASVSSGHLVRKGYRKIALVFSVIILSMQTPGVTQPVYDINYGMLNFPDASRIHKKGTFGQTPGSITLYTNVITVDGQPIDCIITTVGISNGRFEYPTGFCPGTIPFDFKNVQNCPNPDTSAITLSNNEDRFFTPTFYFENGGGSCRFKFEFILGGTFNDATNKGRPVILKRVMVNSYDIDGRVECANPNPDINQFNDFSGFNAAARATPGTMIRYNYNSATGMTRFTSMANCNIRDIKDPRTRIRVEYEYLQELDVVVGMTGFGRAFFMFDFGQGPTWTPMYLGAPVVDLNTQSSGDGYNNTTTLCSTPERVSRGVSNIRSVNNSVNEIIMSIKASEILDGNSELITADITNTAGHITLGSPFTGTVNFTFAGIEYQCQKIELLGARNLSFSKRNGTAMTEVEAEQLLDALVYYNSVNSVGLRHFSLWLREDQVTSAYAFFDVYGGCILLSATGSDLEARATGKEVRLQWTPADPANVRSWMLERSEAGSPWQSVSQGNGHSSDMPTMQLTDKPGRSGVFLYRVINTDLSGNRWLSPQRSVRLDFPMRPFHVYPNPSVGGAFTVISGQDGLVQLIELSGKVLWEGMLRAGTNRLELTRLKPGIYLMCSGTSRERVIIQ